MQPIRIILANHQPIIRSGLRLLLEREPDFRVVAEAANGREAVMLTEFKRPDVVLLEIALPHLNGIAVIKEISSKYCRAKPMVLTAHTEEGYVTEAVKAGAKGYVAADSAPADLVLGIHAVVSGRTFLSPAICMRLLEVYLRNHSISEQEKQVCCLVSSGYSKEEIAVRLNITSIQVQANWRTINEALHDSAFPEAITKSVLANCRETTRV